MTIWVLTCTGGRPEAFELCKMYVERQTVQDFFWVVVDDCVPAEEHVPAKYVFHPTPPWRHGEQTVIRNARAGLSMIGRNAKPEDIVIFVEDDDWYHPRYLEEMIKTGRKLPDDVMIWGEGWTIYYNVVCRRYHVHKNSDRASLCATAMRATFIPEAIEVADEIEGTGKFTYDISLFKRAGERMYIRDSNLCLGVKGLPGRPGCTSGHRYNVPDVYKFDEDLTCLSAWIGDDVDLYRKYYVPPPAPRKTPVPKKPKTREPAIPRRTRKGSAKLPSRVITQINKGRKE